MIILFTADNVQYTERKSLELYLKIDREALYALTDAARNRHYGRIADKTSHAVSRKPRSHMVQDDRL